MKLESLSKKILTYVLIDYDLPDLGICICCPNHWYWVTMNAFLHTSVLCFFNLIDLVEQ